MKNYFALKSITIFTTITLLFSCAEPTTIGSELQDSIDAFVTDTLSLKMTTIREEVVKTFDPNPDAAFSSYLCGNYRDEIMGKTSASVYTQLRVSSAPDASFYAESGSTLDSVILHIPFNFGSNYGDPEESYTFEVYKMTEPMDIGDTLYSNSTFTFDPTPIGSATFTVPDITDTVTYILPRLITSSGTVTVNDTVNIAAHLRIPMSTAFAEEFINLSADNDNLNETDDLQNFINGLHIKSVDTENEGMVGLRLDRLVNAASFGSGITFYYHYPSTSGDTTLFRRHSIFTSSSTTQLVAKTTSASIELSPEVEAAIDVQATGDDLLYLQGLAGPNIQFEIPYADAFRNTIINKADLTLTVASEIDTTRNPPFQVVVATRSGEGTYLVTDDVLFAISRGTFSIFGGQEVENGELRQYTFNLSAVFQTLVDGGNEPLYLRILPKQEQVSRMTVYGPEHSQYPAKLNLVYTKLPE